MSTLSVNASLLSSLGLSSSTSTTTQDLMNQISRVVQNGTDSAGLSQLSGLMKTLQVSDQMDIVSATLSSNNAGTGANVLEMPDSGSGTSSSSSQDSELQSLAQLIEANAGTSQTSGTSTTSWSLLSGDASPARRHE